MDHEMMVNLNSGVLASEYWSVRLNKWEFIDLAVFAQDAGFKIPVMSQEMMWILLK